MLAASVDNRVIAGKFDRIADLMEIEGANPFRVRAYRNAARILETFPENLYEKALRGDDLTEIPTIGKDLAGKIKEIVTTGECSVLQEIQKRVPLTLLELHQIANLGPKRIQTLFQKLKITDLQSLMRAARIGSISKLKGFSEKTEQKILSELSKLKISGEPKRTLWADAEPVAQALTAYMMQAPGITKVAVAGSFRRKKETVGDLDILVTCLRDKQAVKHFAKYHDVASVLSQGHTRCTVLLKSGLQVDLRVVKAEEYGSALYYFTGSKSHNIATRTLALKRGLKINEYGVFKKNKRIGGDTEEEIFQSVCLPYIEPELRENQGEIEAAQNGQLPKLITLEDIRGDLHTHTVATDGKSTLEEMVTAAREKGYSYLGISDHSQRLKLVHGLDKKRLFKQIEEINRLNSKLKKFLILKSCEVDILENGSLDLPAEALRELDYVIGAIHYKLNLSPERQTERLLRAMDNPYLNIIAHPTGRLIGERNPSAINLEVIIKAAKDNGCFLELNGQPQRLDLSDTNCKNSKEFGAKLCLSTDSHNANSLGYMRFAVDQARRGWLESIDVINTLPLDKLRPLFKR